VENYIYNIYIIFLKINWETYFYKIILKLFFINIKIIYILINFFMIIYFYYINIFIKKINNIFNFK